MESSKPETDLEWKPTTDWEWFAYGVRAELAEILEPEELPWPMKALLIAGIIYCFAMGIGGLLGIVTPPPMF